MLETDEILAVQDLKGHDVGHIHVQLFPCDPDGTPTTEKFVENPKDLIGQDLNLLVKIVAAKGLAGSIAESFAQINLFDKFHVPNVLTDRKSGINPSFDHTQKGLPPYQRFTSTLSGGILDFL